MKDKYFCNKPPLDRKALMNSEGNSYPELHLKIRALNGNISPLEGARIYNYSKLQSNQQDYVSFTFFIAHIHQELRNTL